MLPYKKRKCPDCGKTYQVYSWFAIDQTKCIDCRNGIKPIPKEEHWVFQRDIKDPTWKFDQNSKTLPLYFAV